MLWLASYSQHVKVDVGLRFLRGILELSGPCACRGGRREWPSCRRWWRAWRPNGRPGPRCIDGTRNSRPPRSGSRGRGSPSGFITGVMNCATKVPPRVEVRRPRSASLSRASRNEGRDTSSLTARSRSEREFLARPQRAFADQRLQVQGDDVGDLLRAYGDHEALSFSRRTFAQPRQESQHTRIPRQRGSDAPVRRFSL